MILCNRKMMTALLCATAVWSARAAAVLPAVRVEKVGEISRTEAKTYVGTVHGSETVDIVARINGVMWKSAFKEGSIVRKGDLLFQIEDTIYRENVNAAHAALDQNQAELNYAAKEKARYEKLTNQARPRRPRMRTPSARSRSVKPRLWRRKQSWFSRRTTFRIQKSARLFRGASDAMSTAKATTSRRKKGRLRPLSSSTPLKSALP